DARPVAGNRVAVVRQRLFGPGVAAERRVRDGFRGSAFFDDVDQVEVAAGRVVEVAAKHATSALEEGAFVFFFVAGWHFGGFFGARGARRFPRRWRLRGCQKTTRTSPRGLRGPRCRCRSSRWWSGWRATGFPLRGLLRRLRQ